MARTFGPFVSLLFFVLTCIGVAATYGFFDLIEVPRGGMIVGLIAIAIAELLIVRYKFRGTGIESALWLAGVFAFIFGLPGEGRPEALFLFAAGSAIAGYRVKNAIFGALAVVFVVAYFVVKDAPLAAMAVGVGVSALALVALGREWKEATTEQLWIALLIIPPIASAISTLTRTSVWWILLYMLLAVICLVAGVRLRDHAPLIAAGVYAAIVIAKAEAHDLLPLPAEWRLILGGAVLLAASAALARALRDRKTGIVVTPSSLTGYDEEMKILSTLAAQPHAQPAEGQADGGRFGGAGATGDY